MTQPNYAPPPDPNAKPYTPMGQNNPFGLPPQGSTISLPNLLQVGFNNPSTVGQGILDAWSGAGLGSNSISDIMNYMYGFAPQGTTPWTIDQLQPYYNALQGPAGKFGLTLGGLGAIAPNMANNTLPGSTTPGFSVGG